MSPLTTACTRTSPTVIDTDDAVASSTAPDQDAGIADSRSCSHVRRVRPLPSACELRGELALDEALTARIAAHREAVRRILAGDDDRLLVVIGPCSIHDPCAALEYATRLAALQARVSDRLLLVMRVYVEKPRTTTGWKGLAYDPHLDSSDDIAAGLEMSRKLMLDVAALDLPVATELLQPVAAAYFEDLLSWAAIGARTTESQIHREMVSGLDLSVGFKNGTQGNVDIAIAAMRSAAHSHCYFGVTDAGGPGVVETSGNPSTHLVLRGGESLTNHDAESVASSRRAMQAADLPPRIMIDCSHANARKDHRRQVDVLHDVIDQRLAGTSEIIGVMLESHLFEGKQPLNPAALRYGVSITDACLGWDTTEPLINRIAERLRG